MYVIKANGKQEALNLDKMNNWVKWAINGNEAWSDIVAGANIFNGIKTEDIQSSLVSSAEKIILTELNEPEPNYKKIEGLFEAARRLYLPLLQKSIARLEFLNLSDVVSFGIEEGIYDPDLINLKLPKITSLFEADDNIPLCGLKQLMTKYFSKVSYDHSTIFNENPTIMYALMSASDNQEETDLIYEHISKGLINCPTPVAIGLRTPQKEYASCTLAEIPDTMDGIDAAYDLVSKATAARAGLGLSAGAIRPLLASVKNGALKHTGITSFIQAWLKVTKATVQNGVRGGSATINIPSWHRDFNDLVFLKNPDGDLSNRCLEADYCFHYTEGLLKLAIEGKMAGLLDPNTTAGQRGQPYGRSAQEVVEPVLTGLEGQITAYELFYQNPTAFDIWYSEYSQTLPLLKDARPAENCAMPAYDMLVTIAEQLLRTGRIYTFNVTNVNSHTPFNEAIKMTNLCCEILQATHPITRGDAFSEVSLCTLGGIPWGKVSKEQLPRVALAQLTFLDNILNKSETRIPFTQDAINRRNVGVGAIDVAHFLAKKGIKLDDNSKANLHLIGETVHDYMEAVQYALIEASTILAEKRGVVDFFHKTKWADGWLPIDTYKRFEFNQYPLKLDWEALRLKTKQGVRFTVLSAHMPSESSSVIWGYTNGIEPPRSAVSDKSSKVLSVLVPVPEIGELHDKYTYGFDIHNDCYLVIASNIQKFSCQGISFNMYIDYTKTPKIKSEDMLNTLFFKPNAAGIKTTYYANFNVDADDSKRVLVNQDEGCLGGGCTI